MIRRSTSCCPRCSAGFWVEAGILADDAMYNCEHCGARIYVKMRWGKIVSATAAPDVLEHYKGYGGTTPPHRTDDEKRVGNVEYWKDNYGDKWLEAHDEWKRKDDKWWADIGDRL